MAAGQSLDGKATRINCWLYQLEVSSARRPRLRTNGLMNTARSRNVMVVLCFSLGLLIWPASLTVVSGQQVGQTDLEDLTTYTGMLFRISFLDHHFWGLPSGMLTISGEDPVENNRASRLPSWLHFNASSRSLEGIPTTLDVGNTRVLVTLGCQTEIKTVSPSCHSASTSFQIFVQPKKLSDHFLPGTRSLVERSECDSETVLASLIVCVSEDELSWERKLHLVESMADFVSVNPLSFHLEFSPSNSLTAVEMGLQVISAGPGSDVECPLENNMEMLWPLSCPVVKHLSDFAKIIQHNVDVGRFQEELGASIVGWYVASSNSLLTRQHRRRRAVGVQRTIMPTPSLAVSVPTEIQSSLVKSDMSPTSTTSQQSVLSSSLETLDTVLLFSKSKSNMYGSSFSSFPSSIDAHTTPLKTFSFSEVTSLSSRAISRSVLEDTSSFHEIHPTLIVESSASEHFCLSCILTSSRFPVTQSLPNITEFSSMREDVSGVYSIADTRALLQSKRDELFPDESSPLPTVNDTRSGVELPIPHSSAFTIESSPVSMPDLETETEFTPFMSSTSVSSPFSTEISSHSMSAITSQLHTVTDIFPTTASSQDSFQNKSFDSLVSLDSIETDPVSEAKSSLGMQLESVSLTETTPVEQTSTDYDSIMEIDGGSLSTGTILDIDIYPTPLLMQSSVPSAYPESDMELHESFVFISSTSDFERDVSDAQFSLQPSSSPEVITPSIVTPDTGDMFSSLMTTEKEMGTTEVTEEPSMETGSTKFPDHPNSWPIVENPINLIIGEQGRLLEYTIPRDVFYDIEDGDSRDLTLSLELPDRRQLPSNFWLYLEIKKGDPRKMEPRVQVLKGLPLHQDMDINNLSVSLVATDSGGLSCEHSIILQINESPHNRFTHRFTLRFDYDFQEFMRDRRNIYDLMDRIATHFNDSTPRFITVLEVRHGSFILSWTNNTLSGSICQTQAIKQLLNRMMKRDGTVRSSFIRRIGRHLYPIEISFEPMGPCVIPSTTTMASTTMLVSDNEGQDLSVWAHVILPVLIALVVFILILFIIFICNRRRKQRASILNIEKEAFSNERNPIIFPDEVESDDPVLRPKHPLVMPSDPHPAYYQQQSQQQPQIQPQQTQPVNAGSGRSHQQRGHSSQKHRDKNDRRDKDHHKGHRKHKDKDQAEPNRTKSTSLEGPSSRTLDEEERSGASTVTSNMSGSPTKRPPPYWQSQSHPPPYRLPPPYLNEQENGDVANGEGAQQVTFSSGTDNFTTTQV